MFRFQVTGGFVVSCLCDAAAMAGAARKRQGEGACFTCFFVKLTDTGSCRFASRNESVYNGAVKFMAQPLVETEMKSAADGVRPKTRFLTIVLVPIILMLIGASAWTQADLN